MSQWWVEDALKVRGGRWDVPRRFWHREVALKDFDAEFEWMTLDVHDVRGEPSFHDLDRRTRYAAR